MNKLNGWQRAWVVVAMAWAAIVLAWSSLAAPQTPEQLKKEESALIIGYDEYPIGDPRKTETVIKDKKFTASGTVRISDVSRFEELAKKIQSYPHDLTVYIVNSAAVWAFPLIVIYMLGLGVAWVRSGFRRTA